MPGRRIVNPLTGGAVLLDLTAVHRSCSRVATIALVSALAACAPMPAMRGPALDYEVWAMDQGTHKVHIFDSALAEIATIDLGARGARVPHMLEFTSDYRYAFVASPAS